MFLFFQQRPCNSTNTQNYKQRTDQVKYVTNYKTQLHIQLISAIAVLNKHYLKKINTALKITLFIMMADNRDDDELSIPRASLNKMIKEIIPNVRVANDARELILNCCTEFIHLVSTEANDVCNKQLKKTISPEHVLAGMCIGVCNFF